MARSCLVLRHRFLPLQPRRRTAFRVIGLLTGTVRGAVGLCPRQLFLAIGRVGRCSFGLDLVGVGGAIGGTPGLEFVGIGSTPGRLLGQELSGIGGIIGRVPALELIEIGLTPNLMPAQPWLSWRRRCDGRSLSSGGGSPGTRQALCAWWVAKSRSGCEGAGWLFLYLPRSNRPGEDCGQSRAAARAELIRVNETARDRAEAGYAGLLILSCILASQNRPPSASQLRRMVWHRAAAAIEPVAHFLTGLDCGLVYPTDTTSWCADAPDAAGRALFHGEGAEPTQLDALAASRRR